MKTNKNGFTLVEMLVVVSIIGLLVAMLFPVIAKVRQSAKTAAAKKDIQKITIALTNYMADFGDYPPDRFPAAWGAPSGSHVEDIKGSELCEAFLYCLSTKSIKGPYIDIPVKSRSNADNDYYNDPAPADEYDPAKSAWSDGSKANLYEFLDPWGNPYRYYRTQPTSASEGKGFDFWLVSYGPDGKPGFAPGSKELLSGNDDGDGSTDEVDGSEDGYKVLYSTRWVYSDDVVNWR